jgi:hypothetical protein
MEYTNEKLGCSFTLPDKVTVRQQLRYYAAVTTERDEPTQVQMWAGVGVLAEDWKCEALPDPKTSMDDMTNPVQARIVAWAGLAVFRHVDSLEDVPNT